MESSDSTNWATSPASLFRFGFLFCFVFLSTFPDCDVPWNVFEETAGGRCPLTSHRPWCRLKCVSSRPLTHSPTLHPPHALCSHYTLHHHHHHCHLFTLSLSYYLPSVLPPSTCLLLPCQNWELQMSLIAPLKPPKPPQCPSLFGSPRSRSPPLRLRNLSEAGGRRRAIFWCEDR